MVAAPSYFTALADTLNANGNENSIHDSTLRSLKQRKCDRAERLIAKCGGFFNTVERRGNLMVSTSACHARGRWFDSRTRRMTLLGVKTWLAMYVRDCVSLCLSDETLKSRWSLLSGVYARGSKRSHTGCNCATCRGLHSLA